MAESGDEENQDEKQLEGQRLYVSICVVEGEFNGRLN